MDYFLCYIYGGGTDQLLGDSFRAKWAYNLVFFPQKTENINSITCFFPFLTSENIIQEGFFRENPIPSLRDEFSELKLLSTGPPLNIHTHTPWGFKTPFYEFRMEFWNYRYINVDVFIILPLKLSYFSLNQFPNGIFVRFLYSISKVSLNDTLHWYDIQKF